MSSLRNKACKACEGGVEALTLKQAKQLMEEIHPDWVLSDSNDKISRQLIFLNNDQALAFINAVAWVSHSENHHPDLILEQSEVAITYMTHAINGLSENDFICAAKIDGLLEN